jgi:hypothetical protein
MKTKRLLYITVVLGALAISRTRTQAEFRIIHPGEDDEVRVWASPKETGMDFNWSGGTNTRHEAEGFGILEWYKMEKTPHAGRKDYPRLVSQFVYTGELKAGRRDGTGISLPKSGAKYSGQWKDNLKEGNGEYWFSNGDYYAGQFHNDVMQGAGRYVSADGTVFEGNFAADERDGPGVVIFADGRRYSSTWRAGKDTNPAGAPLPDKPYLTLGTDAHAYALDSKVFSSDEGDSAVGAGNEFYLTYRGRWENDAFVIDCDWPYWVAWSKGGPIITLDSSPEGFHIGTHPVFLELRLINRGRDKLEIRKAEAVVDESYPDLEPILRLQDNSDRGGVSCEIVNFTANRVDECEVAFNVLPEHATPTFEKFQVTEKIGPFSTTAKFSVQAGLSAAGLDANAIAAIEKIQYDSPQREKNEQRVRQDLEKRTGFAHPSKGPAFFAYALVAGEIRLSWTDHAGAKQNKRVKFQFRKCLAEFHGAEESVEGPSSGKYDVLLKNAGKNYLVPFNYKRSVAASANDRFTLQVASKASSYQRFRIRLTAVDGREILSPPCRMHFLVPRNFSWKEGHVIEAP